MDKYDVLKHDKKFRYMLLSRMKSDCNYYLGNGNRNKRQLWAENEKDQIEVMKELWNSFEDDGKPEWLTWDELLNYEGEMVHKVETETVEVYTDDYPLGHEIAVSELLEDYPFLKNEEFENALVKISDYEITFNYFDNSHNVIVWKRNNMTGVWADRITFV